MKVLNKHKFLPTSITFHPAIFRSVLAFLFLLMPALLRSETIRPLDLDNWSDGWTLAVHGTTQVSIEDIGGTDYLRIYRSANNGIGAIAFWEGNQTVEDGWFDVHYSGSVITRNTTGPQLRGVIVGAQNMTYNNNPDTNNQGFYIGLLPNSGLGIWKNQLITNSSSESTALAWAPLSSPLPLNTDYLLEFSVTNSFIEGAVWALDMNGQKAGSTALLSINYATTDAGEGYFGLKGGRFGNDNVAIHFRDLQLNVIPEPASMALLTTAGLLLLAKSRHKKN